MNQSDHIEEHLLLKYLLGKCNTEEVTQVDEWLNRSEANRHELDRLESLWLETGKLSTIPVAVDTGAAWKKVEARIDRHEDEQDRAKSRGRVFRMNTIRWTATAAAAIVLAFVFWWIAERISPQEKLQMVVSIEEIVTDTLPDGSSITLNKHSTLMFPEEFTGGQREVTLMGEAFFKVKPDTTSPFIVKAGDAGIEVLGTSFDVKAYPDEMIVVLVSTGKVMLFTVDPVTGDSASVLLTEGMKGILLPGADQPVIDENLSPDELFWMNQTLEFRQALLKDVMDLLMRCYKVTIRLSDKEIGLCRLTASFSEEPIGNILQVIADTFGLTLEIESGTYVLSGNGCPETGI